NLKQLGIAMHNYHGVHKKLPASSFDSLNWGPSAIVYLLPYVEQGNVYQMIDPKAASGSSGPGGLNDQAAATRIPMLMCPTDTQTDWVTEPFGWTNYMVNYGTWLETARGWDGAFAPNFDFGVGSPNAPALRPGGVLGVVRSPRMISFPQIKDGLSNTGGIAE